MSLSDDSSEAIVLTLMVLPGEFSICRLPGNATIPENLDRAEPFVSITRSRDELSIVCPSEIAPSQSESRSDGWRCLRLAGVFELSLTGVLSSVLSPLAALQISAFAISTFDTDYILVQSTDLDRTIVALKQAGIECRP